MPNNSHRQPRLRILANGALLPGATSATVTSNNHYAADRFALQARISETDAAIWSDATEILIDIQITLDGALGWTSLIEGEADHIRIDPYTATLHLEGRDLTARLIEARTQETFANKTSSEIATILAGRHNLTPDVTETKTPVGTYWQLEHDHITLDSFSRSTSEWDFLITLAGHEGFDVWVTGETLHFKPPETDVSPTSLRPRASIAGPANITTLTLERALTLARDIEVVVKSWNSRQAQAFTQTARATRSGSTGGGSTGGGAKPKPQRYVFVVPNLTPDQALKLAQTKLAELSRHERVIEADMPGELALAPRQLILLDGTGTSFDQPYWISEITRRISFAHGFTQHVRARNTNAPAQATTPADPIGSPWNAF